MLLVVLRWWDTITLVRVNRSAIKLKFVVRFLTREWDELLSALIPHQLKLQSMTLRLIAPLPTSIPLHSQDRFCQASCDSDAIREVAFRGLAGARRERGLKRLKLSGKTLIISYCRLHERVSRNNCVCLNLPQLWKKKRGENFSRLSSGRKSRRQKFAGSNIVFGGGSGDDALFIVTGQLQRGDVSSGEVSTLERHHHAVCLLYRRSLKKTLPQESQLRAKGERERERERVKETANWVVFAWFPQSR